MKYNPLFAKRRKEERDSLKPSEAWKLNPDKDREKELKHSCINPDCKIGRCYDTFCWRCRELSIFRRIGIYMDYMETRAENSRERLARKIKRGKKHEKMSKLQS